MPQRIYRFTPSEVQSILQAHLGVPGKSVMRPQFHQQGLEAPTSIGPLSGFTLLFSGVQLEIEDVVLPKPEEERLRRLVD